MGLEEVRGILRRLSGELWDGRAAEAGSGAEAELARRIAGLAEEMLGASARLVRVPVERWRLRGSGVEPGVGWHVIPPYTPSADVEGRPFLVPGDPSEPGAWRRFPGGAVAVALEPPNPDDLKAAALLAWESGASGLLLACEKPRVIVGTGVWGYPYWTGGPMPVPVACVPREGLPILLSSATVRVWVDSALEESWGYTVEADVGGREPLVAFGAHHDRWPGGFSDDALGVAQALAAAVEASRAGLAVRLLSFTAEEHGAPGAPGWYWAWGSRLYFRELAAAGLEESLAAYVNFDLASAGPMASGAPDLVEEAGPAVSGVRCCECPECDSFQAARWAGVPTLSLHSLWMEGLREWYHTPDDDPGRVDWAAAARAVEAGVRAAKAAARGLGWGAFHALLRERLAGGPLRARRMLYIIEATASRVGWRRVYGALARSELRAVHWGSYRHGEGDLEAVWFPEVECARRSGFDEAIVAGEERLLCTGRAAAAPGSLQWLIAAAEERVEEAMRGLIA